MKKQLKHILILLLTLFLGVMLFLIKDKLDEKKEKETLRQTLPAFEFITLNGIVFNNSYLKNNENILIIYFNPDCEECQHEAKQIKDNIHLFNNTRILMISRGSSDKILQFASKFNLINESNIIFLIDTKEIYYQIFDAKMVPNIFIYDSSHQLVKHYEGQTKTETILKYLQ